MSTFYRLIMPGGLIVLGGLLLAQIPGLPEQAPEFARFIPSALFLVGALLGSRFHSSQVVLTMLVLALADWTVHLFGTGDRFSVTASRDVLTALAFLLPLNFAMLSMLPHRGLLASSTLSRFAAILCQPLLIAGICLHWPGALAGGLELSWVDLPFPGDTPLTQPSWLAFAGALVLLPAHHVSAPNAMVGGLAWSLLAVLLALNADPLGVPAVLYISAAAVVLIVAQVERSYLLVFRDELTELPARRALNHALARLGKRYTLAMVDIDHFKKFNDTYGHKVGDQLLRMIGFKLAGLTGGGTAFRYGGEEFALLFPGKLIDEAMPHIEALMDAIRGRPFAIRSPRVQGNPQQPKSVGEPPTRRKVSVTVSIGVAAARTPPEVLGDADAALYRAKEGGRNRIAH